MEIKDQIILDHLYRAIEDGSAVVDYIEPHYSQFNNNYPVINIEVTFTATSPVAPFFYAILRQIDEEQEARRIAQYENHANIDSMPAVPEKKTFVYVMVDKRSGHYKIGRSKDPSYRERTLQSEAPDVELLFHYPAYVNQEKKLHEQFAEKRIRGEWFSLTEQDLEDIKNHLSND